MTVVGGWTESVLIEMNQRRASGCAPSERWVEVERSSGYEHGEYSILK